MSELRVKVASPDHESRAAAQASNGIISDHNITYF